MDKPGIETADSRWKSLYRAGGVTPLVALAFYLTEIVAIAIGGLAGEPYPTSISDWFSLLQRNRILCLLYLNALDIFSIALLGVMFLALYRALKQSDELYAAIAVFFAFVGIAVFIAPRAMVTLALLALGDRYAAATTETQRATLLTHRFPSEPFGACKLASILDGTASEGTPRYRLLRAISWEIGQLWGTGTSQVPASVWNTCQLLYLQGNRCDRRGDV